MEYNLAVDDEDYLPYGETDWSLYDDEEEEAENPWPEEDYYDFPETENDGPWYDPQDGKYW